MDKNERKHKQKSPRELSKAEKRRMEKFALLEQELEEQGYERVDLTVGLVAANVFALILMIPVFLIGFFVYFAVNPMDGDGSLWISIWALLGLIGFTVLHELVHGLTWAVFAEHGMKDIEFGFITKYLTPYATCAAALTRNQYLIGALMPLLLVGIVPWVIGVAIGSMTLNLLGLIMITGAAGDIMISWKMLTHKTDKTDLLYHDHPSEAGMIVFER